jgi:phosphatidylethanolamine/phosphatidyl-N-methylethanolamine N-methyltransferase
LNKPAKPSGRRSAGGLADQLRFLRTLFANPRLTGAVSPSGRFLARAMARAINPPVDGLIVELGPGTGPVTRALIEHGVDEKQLVLVEFEARFCGLLRERFPGVTVLQGDAFDLPRTLAGLGPRPIRAFVSSLPLLNQPPGRRAALIADAFSLMAKDGVFVQFSYGVTSPVPRYAGDRRLRAHAGAPIWANLPPARVWTYRADADGEPVRRTPFRFIGGGRG